MKIAFAKKHLKGYKVSDVCRVLEISRSAYYSCQPTDKSEENAIEQAVVDCYEKNHGNYGRVRICRELLKKGIDIKEHRVGRILRKNGLQGKRRSSQTQKPKQSAQQYLEDNLIRNKFSVTLPNYLLCTDITEMIFVNGKRIYVCGIIDVATRRIVGWAIAKNQKQEPVQKAFEMAIGRNPNRPNRAIYHSDKGSQFTAKKTKELVTKNGFRRSMSRPGKPNDNQPMESFWATMKRELPEIKNMNYEKTVRAIVAYIELCYNTERMHSGIDYHTPNEFLLLLMSVDVDKFLEKS